ncbi:MAG: hypothetical protein WAM24_02750 [Ignavibacteriaceae bacterium]
MKNFIPVFKRICLFVLLNILLINPDILSQTVKQGKLEGFRGYSWGISIDYIKSTETGDYMQSFHGFGIDALSYKGEIAGLVARIDYSFKDGKLFEGTYTINPEDEIKNTFKKLEKYLIEEFGKPKFKAGKSINSDSIWIKISDLGKYKGPELFWKFSNGFIGLIAAKFEEDTTITVLYSNDKSIEEYGSDRLISTDDYK